MTSSPLYLRGYQDALEDRRPDEQLVFTWGYKAGYKVGLATVAKREEAARRRWAA